MALTNSRLRNIDGAIYWLETSIRAPHITLIGVQYKDLSSQLRYILILQGLWPESQITWDYVKVWQGG